MNTIEDLIKDERYKKRVDYLTSEVLEQVVDDRIQALKWAYEQVEQEEPDRKNDIEYIEVVAVGMQKLAKIVLNKRSKSKSRKK